jgi:two-component system sensor histidine kinase PilS (NtrC family)
MEPAAGSELRRRITYLMLFRVVLVTLILGLTVAIHVGSPQELQAPAQLLLFALIVVTYVLSLGYAYWLPRVARPLRFADAQLVGDLVITTVLVHTTGGAQSGYTFLYPLSIVGAATVRYRPGAAIVTGACVALFLATAVGGWLRLVPSPAGETPWDLSGMMLARQLVLNIGACAAIGVLAAFLGDELARSGERLERQTARTLDLAALKEDIIRCLSSGLVTVDAAGRLMTCNAAAGDILGLHPDDALGRRAVDLVPELGPLLAGLRPGEALRRGEIRAVRADGTTLVLGVSASPLVDHTGEPLGRILNFLDLTELRRMETQVRNAERLAVIGGVAAAVAHEIRNPLASISGSIELLRTAPVDAENRELMDIVLREVDRLNRLVTEMLDYARPRDPMALPIDLGAVLDETARVFAQDRGRTHIRVELDVAADAAATRVVADPAQLRQVVWNLLANAADAMPAGGTVTLGLAVAGGWADLTVADHGTGIGADDLEHIFEAFFTTKRAGTGLGLPTVHRIVTAHGGQVSVASEPGRGTTVTVRLRADQAAASAAAALAPQGERGATDTAR